MTDAADVRDLFDLSGVTDRRVDVGDGVELAVSEAGAGGRPLLLLHGFTGSRDDWCSVIGRIADEGHHVLAPDNRGHGDSGRPEEHLAYSFAQVAADCFAVADDAGWDRFALLGHSLGGMVAQLMVLDRPERVDALVLMDTSHAPVAIPPDLLASAIDIVGAGGTAAVLAAMQAMESSAGPMPDQPAHDAACDRLPGYRDLGARNLLRTSAAAYAAFFTELATQADRLERLHEVSCPTLVVVGEQDEPFLGPCLAIGATIPGATVQVIADAAHSPQFENTDAWLDAVLPFLAST